MAVIRLLSFSCLVLFLLTLNFPAARITVSAEDESEETTPEAPSVQQCRSHIEAALRAFITKKQDEPPQTTPTTQESLHQEKIFPKSNRTSFSNFIKNAVQKFQRFLPKILVKMFLTAEEQQHKDSKAKSTLPDTPESKDTIGLASKDKTTEEGEEALGVDKAEVLLQEEYETQLNEIEVSQKDTSEINEGNVEKSEEQISYHDGDHEITTNKAFQKEKETYSQYEDLKEDNIESYKESDSKTEREDEKKSMGEATEKEEETRTEAEDSSELDDRTKAEETNEEDDAKEETQAKENEETATEEDEETINEGEYEETKAEESEEKEETKTEEDEEKEETEAEEDDEKEETKAEEDEEKEETEAEEDNEKEETKAEEDEETEAEDGEETEAEDGEETEAEEGEETEAEGEETEAGKVEESENEDDEESEEIKATEEEDEQAEEDEETKTEEDEGTKTEEDEETKAEEDEETKAEEDGTKAEEDEETKVVEEDDETMSEEEDEKTKTEEEEETKAEEEEEETKTEEDEKSKVDDEETVAGIDEPDVTEESERATGESEVDADEEIEEVTETQEGESAGKVETIGKKHEESKEEITEDEGYDQDIKTEAADTDADHEDTIDSPESKQEFSEGDLQVDKSEADDETQEEGDEEEKEAVESRPHDHIIQILGLDDDSMALTIATERVIHSTLKELKKMYENAVKPMEGLYKFKDISNRFVGDAELFSKPMILFIGPWSSGKSAMINYLLDIEDTKMALKTGAEPQSNGFTVLMYGENEQLMDGIEVAADWTFSSLQKFGQTFQGRLQGVKLPNNLLRKVTIVDTPGILENRKQQERTYPFNDACQWFIDRADIIYVVFDPAKLDMGLEMEALFDQLKGREAQVRIVLNKADSIKPQELMRVQSTLLWNLSPLLGSTEPPIIFVGTFWSKLYLPESPKTLLNAQEDALLQDLRQTIDGRVENKISFTRRHAVRVRNHAKMVDCYLRTYYNHKTFFSNKKKVADEITENPQNYHIYEGLSTLTNVSRYDLPDPDIYRDFFRVNPLYEFKLLTSTCSYFKGCPLDRLDVAIAYDLPELMGKYRKQIGTSSFNERR